MKKAADRKFSEQTYMTDFFESFGLKIENMAITPAEYISSVPEEKLEDLGIEPETFFISLEAFVADFESMMSDKGMNVESLTIVGGQDKSGNPENVKLTINKGDIICIVGPTGSGKSRLLADIEWLADGDTPTGRRILINGEKPDLSIRYSPEHKLVAQLSQNMNFVMDLTAEEFVMMHAESRLVENPAEKTALIIEQANMLAGEQFKPDTPVTSLSGGQSRALMIADTAFLSKSPVVLVDEIENAGIDRKKALELLVKEEKLVLMATHDPILALMGSKRIVIKNGGIHEIIETSSEERGSLEALRKLDEKLLTMRNILRTGGRLNNIDDTII
ncbi:ABC transporter ATP-binding protein [Geovibrio thiophilus]|uniref:ABC transporter ATP-binding protein n=1 Tax=Geovibrio thiophilus TaxID=139438 RepID=A0A410JYY9_9BACT|nr:ABC transporter ATP-binding protein [Geovibrio thiophilus]QAR33372.1 ABC transporter ATP-binding protein [Geovibrio thiophilus]